MKRLTQIITVMLALTVSTLCQARLGPGEQAQGRAAYNRFWRGIDAVDVRSATARPGVDGAGTVEVTLVYRGTNGTTSTERKREGLVPDGDGGYLIDSDQPAS